MSLTYEDIRRLSPQAALEKMLERIEELETRVQQLEAALRRKE